MGNRTGHGLAICANVPAGISRQMNRQDKTANQYCTEKQIKKIQKTKYVTCYNIYIKSVTKCKDVTYHSIKEFVLVFNII